MDRMDRSDAAGVSRDAAGIGPHARTGAQLVSFRELDGYNVAEGDADVRGWEVRTLSGRELGKVADMLVDTSTNEVVMLDVDLHGTDRHTLAPVRAAQLDRSRRVVLLDSADLEDASAIPSLQRNVAPSDEEGRHFHDRYQRAYGDRGWDKDRDWQVNRGDHDIEFRRRPHDVDRSAAVGLGAAGGAVAGDAATRERQLHEEERNREAHLREADRLEAHRREVAARDAQLAEQTRRDAERRAEGQDHEGEPQRLTDAGAAGNRQVRWSQGQARDEEVVVERRPVIEEVIIRRRVVDPDTLRDQK